MHKNSIEKRVISVGITGSRISKKQTPYIPITPEEMLLVQKKLEKY